jgi:hypothetical protein
MSQENVELVRAGYERFTTTGAQIWTRDGKRTRMEMYSDPAEALAAAGLSE